VPEKTLLAAPDRKPNEGKRTVGDPSFVVERELVPQGGGGLRGSVRWSPRDLPSRKRAEELGHGCLEKRDLFLEGSIKKRGMAGEVKPKGDGQARGRRKCRPVGEGEASNRAGKKPALKITKIHFVRSDGALKEEGFADARLKKKVAYRMQKGAERSASLPGGGRETQEASCWEACTAGKSDVLLLKP